MTSDDTLPASAGEIAPAPPQPIAKAEFGTAVTAPFQPPLAAGDLLTQAMAIVTPYLDRSMSVGERLRNLWAAAVAARELGATDVIEEEFLRLALSVGLAADLGRRADDDLHHVIRWAILNQNPFD